MAYVEARCGAFCRNSYRPLQAEASTRGHTGASVMRHVRLT